jgi:hypothetical protein
MRHLNDFNFLLKCAEVYWGGPAISHHYTVSLVQWVNLLLPTEGVSSSHPGNALSQWNLVSPVSDDLLYWWLRHDWSLALPWAPCWQWEASLGFVPTMWKASCDYTLPSPVPFHSLQVLLLLATQWPVRALLNCWGKPCEGPAISHSLSGPVGQPLASRLGVSGSCPGDAHSQWNRLSPVIDVLLQYDILIIPHLFRWQGISLHIDWVIMERYFMSTVLMPSKNPCRMTEI